MIPAMKRDRLTRPAPDRAAALAQYRRRAGFYDLELALLEPLRRRAIALLALRPGEVVLDVGCGTGLSLGLLSQAIGATGRIIGIEQSPEMIELARQRVVHRQLPGVTLLNSRAQQLYSSEGFVEEGRLRESVRLTGNNADGYDSLIVMSLLDREYQARQALGLEAG